MTHDIWNSYQGNNLEKGKDCKGENIRRNVVVNIAHVLLFTEPIYEFLKNHKL